MIFLIDEGTKVPQSKNKIKEHSANFYRRMLLYFLGLQLVLKIYNVNATKQFL